MIRTDNTSQQKEAWKLEERCIEVLLLIGKLLKLLAHTYPWLSREKAGNSIMLLVFVENKKLYLVPGSIPCWSLEHF